MWLQLPQPVSKSVPYGTGSRRSKSTLEITSCTTVLWFEMTCSTYHQKRAISRRPLVGDVTSAHASISCTQDRPLDPKAPFLKVWTASTPALHTSHAQVTSPPATHCSFSVFSHRQNPVLSTSLVTQLVCRQHQLTPDPKSWFD